MRYSFCTFFFIHFALSPLIEAAASPAQRAAPAPGSARRQELLYYKGVDGNVHGPFQRGRIEAWWHHGYFPEVVPISYNRDGPFFAMNIKFEQTLKDVSDGGGFSATYSADPSADVMPSAHAAPSKSASKLMKFNISHILRMETRRFAPAGINQMVRYYARLNGDAMLKAIWKPFAAEALIESIQFLLIFRLMILLSGILISQYIDLIQMPPIAAVCLREANVYSERLSTPTNLDVDMISHLLRSATNSPVWRVFLYSFALLIISFIAKPAAIEAATMASQRWHFDQQLFENLTEMRAKFDYTEESHHSVDLLRSLIVMSILVAASTSAAIALSSPLFFVTAICIAWQSYTLILLPNVNLHHNPPRYGSADDQDNFKTASQRTRDIEDAIDSRTGDSALRWPTLFKDLNLARQRALMIVKETLQSRAHLFIASSAALKLVAQIITLFFAICKVSTIEKTNISQSSQHWGSDSFVRKYLMIAFNEHSITRLSVAHADVLFGVAAIAQTHFISLVLPFIMWFLGAYRMSIGLRGITALQNQWAGRVLLTSNDEVDFLRNHEVSNHRSENGGEWEVLAPSKIHGITLDHVTAVGSGRVRLRDVSVHIPAGKLTILIGSRNVDAEINSLFRLIWGGHDLDRDDETVILQKGHVKIHGLDMRDWKLNALRDCTVLMTDNEKHMPLNLGKLCGLNMDNTLDGIDRQRTAIALSGIAEVEKLFSDGYNADLGLLSKTILSADQWRKIYLCRALCSWNKDIILLQSPTVHMSELEEKRFLESLKRLIREDQIVIVSSVRHETARYADYAVLCEKGRGLRVLESRQQFDSTVLSDHNHL